MLGGFAQDVCIFILTLLLMVNVNTRSTTLASACESVVRHFDVVGFHLSLNCCAVAAVFVLAALPWGGILDFNSEVLTSKTQVFQDFLDIIIYINTSTPAEYGKEQ